MPLGRMRIFRRVADGEDVLRLDAFGDAEKLADNRGIETGHPAASQPQIGRLQKHVRRHDRGVGVDHTLAVVGPHPRFGRDAADDDRQGIALHIGAFGELLQSFSTLYDEELVRLVVFRRRSYAPRLKDAFKLFRLDGLGEIGADGISFLGKREKVIHGKPPKLFARTIGV